MASSEDFMSTAFADDITDQELDEILSFGDKPTTSSISHTQTSNKTDSQNVLDFDRQRLDAIQNSQSPPFAPDLIFSPYPDIHCSLPSISEDVVLQNTSEEHIFPIDLTTMKNRQGDTFSLSQNQTTNHMFDPIVQELKQEFKDSDSELFPQSDRASSSLDIDDDIFSIPLPSFLRDDTQNTPSENDPNVMNFVSANYSEATSNCKQESIEPSNQTQKSKVPSENPSSILTPPADVSLIPTSVSRLFSTITDSFSDFAFVYALSAQMCQDLMPMDCYVNLKMGLLLSIASIEINGPRPPIHIVVIGKDCSYANLLMNNIGNVARRLVVPSDNFKTGSFSKGMIEGGPISWAKSGVCYMGNWSRLKQAQSDKIFKDLERGRFAIDNSTFTFPVQCAIWCHWNSYKHNTKDQHMFNKFLEIFGIPFALDEKPNENLIDFILEQSCVNQPESTIDELSISADDMRNFLDVVSRRKVDVSADAVEILRRYFVASRIDRPDCLTQQAFTTIKQFAESFAKLSFRHEVIAIDAIAAIYLSESFIHQIFGPGTHPPPTFSSHNYIGDVDVFMNEFQQWLQSYLEKFSNED